jgi:hypothetical protein
MASLTLKVQQNTDGAVSTDASTLSHTDAYANAFANTNANANANTNADSGTLSTRGFFFDARVVRSQAYLLQITTF